MRWALRALGLALALALVLLGWGYRGVTREPVVVEMTHAVPGLPPGARIRVAVLSDTHHGRPDMPTGRLERLVEQVNGLSPDLVLLLGDYKGGKILDFEPRPNLEPAVRPFARLQAPLGVFAVMGNHDSPRWSGPVFAAQKTPRLLVNEAVETGPLVLAGINSAALGADVPGTLAKAAPGRPVLVLLHEGDHLLRVPPPARSVLVLAAHTHGGQILLPLVGSLGRLVLGPTACLRGACTVNGWPVIVTSGVGASWLPLRIGVPPEILLLTLVPDAGGDQASGRKSGTDR